MKAAEFARLLNAKKVGREKWLARCPAHSPDRQPSLSIAEGRKVPVIIVCRSQGCSTKEILAAMDLTWSSLFDGKPTPAIRQRMVEEDYLRNLEKCLGLADFLAAIESDKRHYWRRAASNMEKKIVRLRLKLYPAEPLPIRYRSAKL
jgi:hypothetical protein